MGLGKNDVLLQLDGPFLSVVCCKTLKYNGRLGEFLSKLDEAQARLERALSSFERVLEEKQEVASDHSRVQAEEINQAMAFAKKLKDTNGQVSLRLDKVISSVREILKG